MGRTGKPAAVKEAQGNPGRRPIAREAGATPASALAPPKNLRGRPRALWEQLAPKLAAARLLRETDLGAFRRYCSFLAKWEQAEILLKNADLVHTTNSEHVQNLERISKALMVAVMIDKRLSEIEDRFGMNPAGRQRLMMQQASIGAQQGLPFDQEVKTTSAVPGVAVVPEVMPTSPVGLLN